MATASSYATTSLDPVLRRCHHRMPLSNAVMVTPVNQLRQIRHVACSRLISSSAVLRGEDRMLAHALLRPVTHKLCTAAGSRWLPVRAHATGFGSGGSRDSSHRISEDSQNPSQPKAPKKPGLPDAQRLILGAIVLAAITGLNILSDGHVGWLGEEILQGLAQIWVSVAVLERIYQVCCLYQRVHFADPLLCN